MKRLTQGVALALILLAVGGARSSGFSSASLNGSCIWQILAVPTTSGDQINAGPGRLCPGQPLTAGGM